MAVEKYWLNELARMDAEEGRPYADPEAGLPLLQAIGKLRDEVTGLLLQRHRGQSRELSMLLTKLDEARLWGVQYGEKVMTHQVVNRQSVMRAVAETRTDTTGTTVPTGAGRGLTDV